jgi:beta-N-acetylhexosaminidase
VLAKHQSGIVNVLLVSMLALACASAQGAGGEGEESGEYASRASRHVDVRPGITVLLRDSSALIAGKRVGLLTNQSGIDEKGRSDIDLLAHADSIYGISPAPRLVSLFAPEHGIRGTEDRSNIANDIDERTGLTIHSLYNPTTIEPPDSTLRDLDVLIIDLQDLGTRTWTYPASMVYAMRAAARNHLQVLVLDRPNPITGAWVEGPLLDSSQTYAGSYTPTRRPQPVSLYPLPLRHGLTMGELALFYNDQLGIDADLKVIPADGWRRDVWFDETGLPWVKPSPNMPSLESALLYPATVPFEGTNLSVGRGTPDAFQRLGAPWLNADSTVALLNDRGLNGVIFSVDRRAPRDPTDRKYGGVEIPWIKIEITDRDRVQTSRIGAALLWAIARVNPDSLRIREASFDERFGPARLREQLVKGEDPDTVIDDQLPLIIDFERSTKPYRLYH